MVQGSLALCFSNLVFIVVAGAFASTAPLLGFDLLFSCSDDAAGVGAGFGFCFSAVLDLDRVLGAERPQTTRPLEGLLTCYDLCLV